MNQEAGRHQTLHLPASILSQLPSLQNCERYISVASKLLSLWYFIREAQVDGT